MMYKTVEIKIYHLANTPNKVSLSIEAQGCRHQEDGYLYEIRALQRAKQLVDEGWPKSRSVSPQPPWNEKPLPDYKI